MPYDIAFPAQTNSADWAASVEIYDDETNEVLADLDAYTFSLVVRDKCDDILLSATSDDDEITIDADTGLVSWRFPKSELSGFEVPANLSVGMVMEDADGNIIQTFIGKLPMIDGVVR